MVGKDTRDMEFDDSGRYDILRCGILRMRAYDDRIDRWGFDLGGSDGIRHTLHSLQA